MTVYKNQLLLPVNATSRLFSYIFCAITITDFPLNSQIQIPSYTSSKYSN